MIVENKVKQVQLTIHNRIVLKYASIIGPTHFDIPFWFNIATQSYASVDSVGGDEKWVGSQ